MTMIKKQLVQWLVLFVFATCSSIVLVAFYNYRLDPYGVLRSELNGRFLEPNQAYLKIDYLLQNVNKFDTFVFGTSKVGHIPIQKVLGERAYNMTQSEALPREHVEQLQLLLSKGLKLKRLFVGIDQPSYRLDPDVHREQLLRRPHPLISGDSLYDFFWQYIIRAPSVLDLYHWNNKIMFLVNSSPPIFDFKLWRHGRNICEACDNNIDLDPEVHREKMRNLGMYPYPKGYPSTAFFTDISRLIALAEKHNFSITFFFNPIYYKAYLQMDFAELFRIKKQLVEYSSFYDFIGDYQENSEPLNFYEAIHFRPQVGEKMLRIMVANETKKNGFGAFVSKDNIQLHHDALVNQLVGTAKHNQLRNAILRDDYIVNERKRIVISEAKMQRLLSKEKAICSFDTINDQLAKTVLSEDLLLGRSIKIEGWIGSRQREFNEVVVMFEERGGNQLLYQAVSGLYRKDVKNVFGQTFLRSGFYIEAEIEPSSISVIRLFGKADKNYFECDKQWQVRVD